MRAHVQGRSAGALRRGRALAAVALAGALVLGCGGAGDAADDRPLRVSAPYGLSSLRDLNQDVSGSSASIGDLILDRVTAHAEVIKIQGRTAYLQPLLTEPLSVDELATVLRAPGLISARAEAGLVVADFDEPAQARRLANRNAAGFAVGAYQLDDEDIAAGWVRLRSRGEGAMEIIEFIEVDAAEQWRRLHARHVDVVPSSPYPSRDAYEGMSSVRIIDYPAEGAIAIYFNARAAALADPAVRRAIARTLDRRAIAAIACGSSDCVIPWPVTEEAVGPLPASLRLLVLGSDSLAVDAARAARLQLLGAGIEVALALVDIPGLTVGIAGRRFELMISPIPVAQAAIFQQLRRDAPQNVTGWWRPDFEAAVDARDHVEALKILRDELPVLPLFEDRAFAAVDARFCGGAPETGSWRWLADLHPCEEEGTR